MGHEWFISQCGEILKHRDGRYEAELRYLLGDDGFIDHIGQKRWVSAESLIELKKLIVARRKIQEQNT